MDDLTLIFVSPSFWVNVRKIVRKNVVGPIEVPCVVFLSSGYENRKGDNDQESI